MLNLFKKYLVPSLVFCLASIQLCLSRFDSISNWKLGGYGMYSTYHPTTYAVWVEIDEKRIQANEIDYLNSDDEYLRMVDVCTYHPSSSNLRELFNTIRNKENTSKVIVEVWRPDFNSITKEYSRILVNRYEE